MTQIDFKSSCGSNKDFSSINFGDWFWFDGEVYIKDGNYHGFCVRMRERKLFQISQIVTIVKRVEITYE